MLHSPRRIGLTIVLLGLLLAPFALAGEKSRPVQDEAKLFSEKALDEANAIIAKIKDKHGKDLVIETKEKGAPDLETSAKQAAARAEQLASKSGFDGVYIIITKDPKQLQVQLIKKDKTLLTIEDRNELAKLLRANLGKDPNDALLKVTQRTLEIMADRYKTAKVDTTPRTVNDEAKVFGKEAVDEVNEIVAKIKKQHGKDLLIETVAEGPPKDDAPKWARERHDKSGIDGVYVVIAKKPGYFRIVVSDKTLKKLFKQSDIDELTKILSQKINGDKRITLAAIYVQEVMNKASEPELKKDEQ